MVTPRGSISSFPNMAMNNTSSINGKMMVKNAAIGVRQKARLWYRT